MFTQQQLQPSLQQQSRNQTRGENMWEKTRLEKIISQHYHNDEEDAGMSLLPKETEVRTEINYVFVG